MSDFMDKQKDEFDNFVDKWEKAQEAGIFKDAEMPSVNPQTSRDSFFGLQQSNPTDSVTVTDGDYWKAIYSASTDFTPVNEIINEADEHKGIPSNPVERDTMGQDQELKPQSLGLTYNEEDIKKLDELKRELFALENKRLTSMGFGDDKNEKKYQVQIESVKKEINKLSDEMGRAYKNTDQPKHLENI
jgi:hypothetical protein